MLRLRHLLMIQNQVVLSLGSNIGDRLDNISRCIALIHSHAGTVVRISKVYETPAWGFEGDAFYNVALLLHTSLAAEDLLEKILDVEEQLGRVRSDAKGYQSRIID